MSEKYEMNLRVDKDLITEIDKRIEQMKTEGRTVSRNQWFANMARWVIDELPHRADNHDLHWAMHAIPEEGLPRDIPREARHWHRYTRGDNGQCECGAVRPPEYT